MIPKIEFKICGQGNNPEAYKKCEEFISEWQKILKIQDWTIKLCFISGEEMIDEMGSGDYVASCDRELHNKYATIRINIEHSRVNEDIYNTLLHELLHIVTYEWQHFTEEAIYNNDYALKACKAKMEQTVESLAKSFRLFVKEGEVNE